MPKAAKEAAAAPRKWGLSLAAKFFIIAEILALSAALAASLMLEDKLAAALAIAALLGAAASFLLCRIVSLPLRSLARRADAMRSAENKQLLRDMKINISSKDEIGQLAEALNEMARALANVADIEIEMAIGKEMQKMLIPLETDSTGRKLAHGGMQNEAAAFFGYYEAASGVSGDYFDYINLDGKNVAFIKCDVAGSGIPAALIMAEVAAVFKGFFGEWSAGNEEKRLSVLAAKINDLIEARKSRFVFAALMLGIFDCESGRLSLCCAGDTVAHIFDASSGKMTGYLLCESPAAGIFPSSAINGGDGFITEELALKKGDALFLYTDGIYEAKRLFRGKDFNPALNKLGEDGEVLTEKRVEEIIEAVFAKGAFTLKKQDDPEGPEKEYRFDFSACEGTVEEAVAALVAVEKVFRMYKNPAFTEAGTVQADILIDSFLQKHFAQYDEYCAHKRVRKELPSSLLYAGLGEDPQFDDLAILAIMKK